MRQDGQGSIRGEQGSGKDLYEEVTGRIVGELERGNVPWVQPWGASKTALSLPRNGLTGQSYSVGMAGIVCVRAGDLRGQKRGESPVCRLRLGLNSRPESARSDADTGARRGMEWSLRGEPARGYARRLG